LTVVFLQQGRACGRDPPQEKKEKSQKSFLDSNIDYYNILYINKGESMINFKDLKKGDEIRSTQLGPPIDGKLMESPKQGKGIKKVILIYSKGSTVGMFDEHGSVYATDIVEVERDGKWHEVNHG
jgi:hypothetical protein